MNQLPVLEVELRPFGGEFLLTITKGDLLPQHIKGRFSMNTLDRFCDTAGVENYFDLLTRITMGMKIRDYALLVSIAIQDYYREDYSQCPWSPARVMDEIFDIEGFGSKKLMGLFQHAIGRIADILPPEDQEEKKSPVNGQTHQTESSSKSRQRKRG